MPVTRSGSANAAADAAGQGQGAVDRQPPSSTETGEVQEAPNQETDATAPEPVTQRRGDIDAGVEVETVDEDELSSEEFIEMAATVAESVILSQESGESLEEQLDQLSRASIHREEEAQEEPEPTTATTAASTAARARAPEEEPRTTGGSRLNHQNQAGAERTSTQNHTRGASSAHRPSPPLSQIGIEQRPREAPNEPVPPQEAAPTSRPAPEATEEQQGYLRQLLASAVRRQNHSEQEAAQLRQTNQALRERIFHQQMAAAQRQANAEEHEGEPREQRAHTSQSQRQCDQSSSSSSNADEDEDTEIPTIDVMTKSGSRIEKKFVQPLLVTPCDRIDLKVVIRLLKLQLARISNHASSDPKNAKAAISSFLINTPGGAVNTLTDPMEVTKQEIDEHAQLIASRGGAEAQISAWMYSAFSQSITGDASKAIEREEDTSKSCMNLGGVQVPVNLAVWMPYALVKAATCGRSKDSLLLDFNSRLTKSSIDKLCLESKDINHIADAVKELAHEGRILGPEARATFNNPTTKQTIILSVAAAMFTYGNSVAGVHAQQYSSANPASTIEDFLQHMASNAQHHSAASDAHRISQRKLTGTGRSGLSTGRGLSALALAGELTPRGRDERIISRIAANLVLHLFAQWIIPPIIIDFIRWLYGPPSDPADAHASSQATGLWYSIQQRQYCFNQDFANSSTNHTEEGDEPAHDGSSNRSQGNESHTVLWYQNHQETQAHASTTSTSAAHKVHFDTDSFLIGDDTQATQCISPNPNHFEDLVPISNKFCQGFEGQKAEIKGSGTLVFHMADDNGAVHPIRIPNSLYIPTATKVLLVPQHWAQEANDTTPLRYGTMCQAVDNGVILYWNQQRYQKRVALDPNSNVPIFRTAAYSSSYDNFAANTDAIEASPAEQVFDLTPDGQRQRESFRDYIGDEDIHIYEDDNRSIHSSDNTIITNNTTSSTAREGPLHFELSSNSTVDPHRSHQATTLQAELMRWHYRLGHLPFSKIRLLANNGEIPKYLAKILPPFCSACMYGAMHRIRRRNSKISQIYRARRPGERVSVDQLESPQVGFIAQMKGRLTNDRYTAATVFVDHYSRARYIHLMKDLTSEETLRAKLAFEQWALLHGVTIQHYHCDNGRFADKAFVEACAQQ
ncbi:hypothetical protein THAOC_06737, partial [Thalassiosira oceanica]